MDIKLLMNLEFRGNLGRHKTTINDMQGSSTNLFFICIRCKQSTLPTVCTNARNVPSAPIFLISPDSKQPAKIKADVSELYVVYLLMFSFHIIESLSYAQHI